MASKALQVMQVVVVGSSSWGVGQPQMSPRMTRLFGQEEQVVVEEQVLQTGMHCTQIVPSSRNPSRQAVQVVLVAQAEQPDRQVMQVGGVALVWNSVFVQKQVVTPGVEKKKKPPPPVLLLVNVG